MAMAEVTAQFKYPKDLTREQQEKLQLIEDAFANFDLVESFSRMHLEKSTYPQQNWKEAVDMIMEEEPNEKVKLALRRWKVGSATNMADVVLAPDFDAKTMCFRFSLRAFKGKGSEEVEFMEALVEKDTKVMRKEVHVGFVRRGWQLLANAFAGDSYKTSQQERDELEEKLIAALADDPTMKAYIGRAMANVLRTMNIEAIAV